ncbi:GntR family transcriptional regulator [Curtobacterium sp. TC1]|uniref:GntR family transcriptional regulator n=1 Tax=Curtobacterium sp. TC1 TaxID=2862880 RepID=UPI001C9A7092|nr:GntR family transcriptional regulator [Curtobacterium sp. TC1]QZQ55717.1 GntR family transcriptional regulator [Curtobacterium sp. TC1]
MPKYLERRHHRARLLRDMLRDELLRGDGGVATLPSEDELIRRHQVGRNVVREALDLLVSERLIRRVRGQGTEPTAHVIVHHLNQLRAIGEPGHSTVEGNAIHYRKLSWELVPAPQVVAENLLVPLGTPVIRWERITASRDPLVLWTSYFRSDLGLQEPGEETPGVDAGTWGFLEAAGIELGEAAVRTGAVPADPAVAELLSTEPSAPLLVQHRLLTDATGRPIEFAVGYYRGDLIVISNTLRRHRDAV